MTKRAADPRERPSPAPRAVSGGRLARHIPILGWIRGYERAHLRGDVAAGLTVAVMLIPQGMAYAGLAGMSPITGLYAAIVGIVVYSLLGTSGSLAVGPVAITSLMTLEGVRRIAEPGDPGYAATVSLLALLTGAILLALGLARLGSLVDLLSHPVIGGFTSAAALVIALSQVDDLLGVDIGRPDGTIATLRALAGELGEVDGSTLAMAIAALLALAAGRRWARRLPTALIVVTLATLATWRFDLADRGIAVLGDVPSGFPSPTLPDMSAGLIGDLFPVALTIAVVAFAEGASVASAMARRTRDSIDADQELIATGAANVAAGAFSGFPIAGGFSRTAVNHEAGARTPLAGLITAAVLLVAVLWFTPLFFHLPRAVLAAIITVAVLGLVDIADARRTAAVGRSDGATFAVTFLMTLFVGIEAGLIAGIGFALAAFVWRNARPHTVELGRVPGTAEFRNVARWETRTDPSTAVVRTDGPLFFANSRRLDGFVQRLVADRPDLRAVVLDASAISDIDATGIHALSDLDRDLADAGVTLRLATVRGPVRDALDRAGAWDGLEGRVHPSLSTACAAADPDGPLCGPRPDEPDCDVDLV